MNHHTALHIKPGYTLIHTVYLLLFSAIMKKVIISDQIQFTLLWVKKKKVCVRLDFEEFTER